LYARRCIKQLKKYIYNEGKKNEMEIKQLIKKGAKLQNVLKETK